MHYVLPRAATAALLSLIFAAEAQALGSVPSTAEVRLPQWRTAINDFIGATAPSRVPNDEPCASAIGRFETDIFLRGTGAVTVHPRLVLTNAHVIASEGTAKHRVTFELPFRGKFRTYPGTVVSVGTMHPDKVGHWLRDWAIVVLDSDAATEPLDFGTPPLEFLNRHRGELFMISYSRLKSLPGSGDQFPVISRSCSVHGTESGLFTHDCSSVYGASGSPLLTRIGNWCASVGLHIGGKQIASAKKERLTFSRDTHNYAIPATSYRDEFIRVVNALKDGQSADAIRLIR